MGMPREVGKGFPGGRGCSSPLTPRGGGGGDDRGVGSVNFRTADFGGAFFDRSYCVLCVLSDALVFEMA